MEKLFGSLEEHAKGFWNSVIIDCGLVKMVICVGWKDNDLEERLQMSE